MNLTLPAEVQRLADQLEQVEKDLKFYTETLDKSEQHRYEAGKALSNLEEDYNNNYKYHFMYLVTTETVEGKKAFPNKEARDLEAARRLDQDEGAKELRGLIEGQRDAKFKADRSNFQCRDAIKDLARQHNGIVAMLHVYAELLHSNTISEVRSGTV